MKARAEKVWKNCPRCGNLAAVNMKYPNAPHICSVCKVKDKYAALEKEHGWKPYRFKSEG